MNPGYDVVAVGSAIVDLLAQVEDATVAATGLEPGTMTLIDRSEAERLWRVAEGGVPVAGGSAANTTVGVAALGGRVALVGRVGADELGRSFAADLVASGVAFVAPPAADGPTGRCVILVTPDGQRTMRTFLGVAPQLEPDCVDESLIDGAVFVYLEGYLWDAPPALDSLHRIIDLARRSGAQVALTLSDPGCVERHRKEWLELLGEGRVDLLFANEEEVLRLIETRDLPAAASAVGGMVGTAALTRGPAGCLVVRGAEVATVPAHPVERVVDTTGAGDLFAAGYLVGAARGRSAVECARLGALAAADVISAIGARPHGDVLALARAESLL